MCVGSNKVDVLVNLYEIGRNITQSLKIANDIKKHTREEDYIWDLIEILIDNLSDTIDDYNVLVKSVGDMMRG